MKNMKLKKWGIIAGLGLVCCVLIIAIGGRFVTEPPADDIPQATDPVAPVVNPNTDATPKDPATELVIKPETNQVPSDNGGAVSSGTEQTIQPDPVKPQEPPEKPSTAIDTEKPHEPPKDTTLTDPAKKPDSTPKPAETPKPTESTPKNGDKRTVNGENQIYVLGFGWIKDEGGGAQGSDSKLDPEHADFDKIIGH